MFDFYNDPIGAIHLTTALLATITGTMILSMRKGTRQHIRIGYIYVASMAVLNISAFLIYELFGHFGIFHWAAVFSSLTVLGGMIPLIKKPPGWLHRHFAFMYWSVIGLYAAFASETLARVPETPFFGMIGLATGVVMLLGAIFYRKNREKWKKQFARLMN